MSWFGLKCVGKGRGKRPMGNAQHPNRAALGKLRQFYFLVIRPAVQKIVYGDKCLYRLHYLKGNGLPVAVEPCYFLVIFTVCNQKGIAYFIVNWNQLVIGRCFEQKQIYFVQFAAFCVVHFIMVFPACVKGKML